MDATQVKGRLKRKVIMHMLFQFGGSIVIIGALFKILHIDIGPISGGFVLGVGLIMEAVIFFVGGLMLDDVHEEQEEFLHNRQLRKTGIGNTEEGLSEKIDAMLREAKLDVTVVDGLKKSIENLEASAKALAPAAEVISSSNNYSQQLDVASKKLSSLNELYDSQLKNATSTGEYNDQIAQNAERLKAQMDLLSANLASLNEVYEAMLKAMNKN